MTQEVNQEVDQEVNQEVDQGAGAGAMCGAGGERRSSGTENAPPGTPARNGPTATEDWPRGWRCWERRIVSKYYLFVTSLL